MFVNAVLDRLIQNLQISKRHFCHKLRKIEFKLQHLLILIIQNKSSQLQCPPLLVNIHREEAVSAVFHKQRIQICTRPQVVVTQVVEVASYVHVCGVVCMADCRCLCVDNVRTRGSELNVFDSNTTRRRVGENPPEHSSKAMESIWRAQRTKRTEKGRITT